MKKKISRKIILLLAVLFPATFTFQSCEDPILKDIITEVINSLVDGTGWLMDDENMNDIPEDITPFDNGDTELKTVVDLSSKFPPIGDQGQYGTCVTWAVGYNMKTALNGIENSWTTADLAKTSNQTSPKDLWFAIPSASKGSNCGGTNFEPAMDALISKGAASLSTSPYTSLGNCNGTATGSSTNKLANYRKIAYSSSLTKTKSSGLDAENFKGYLNAGRPIAIGAKLGDRFMTWNSSSVISSDTYRDPGMQHAYHAMVLVGYDDSKSAFRVRNSWGRTWGDNGSIWVDYDFFLKNFCFAAFVAQNTNSASASGGTISSGLSSGADLMAYFAEDIDDPDYSDARERLFSYEVYNSGNTTITADKRWTVVYMYYNAADAEDYEVIFDDYYTNEYGSLGEYEFNENSTALLGGFWNHVNVASGKLAGESEFGEEGFQIEYTMPAITGKYYLVVLADA